MVSCTLLQSEKINPFPYGINTQYWSIMLWSSNYFMAPYRENQL